MKFNLNMDTVHRLVLRSSICHHNRRVLQLSSQQWKIHYDKYHHFETNIIWQFVMRGFESGPNAVGSELITASHICRGQFSILSCLSVQEILILINVMICNNDILMIWMEDNLYFPNGLHVIVKLLLKRL